LLLSVIVVGVVAAATPFIDIFSDGVKALSDDVYALLTGDDTGPRAGSSNAGGIPWVPPPSGGSGGGGSGGSTDDGGSTDEGSGDTGGSTDTGDTGSDDSGTTEEEPPPEDETTCPYVYDEASERWRDPETGQYVSSAEATAAGC
jgi:hypothetical protein